MGKGLELHCAKVYLSFVEYFENKKFSNDRFVCHSSLRRQLTHGHSNLKK